MKSSRSKGSKSARSNSSTVRRVSKSLSKGRYNEDLVAQRIYSNNKKLNSVRPIEIATKKQFKKLHPECFPPQQDQFINIFNEGD